MGGGDRLQKSQLCDLPTHSQGNLQATNMAGQLMDGKNLLQGQTGTGNRPGTTLGGQAWRGHLRDKF